MKARNILAAAAGLLSVGLAGATVQAATEMAKKYDHQPTTRIDTLHKRIRAGRRNDSPAYRKSTWPPTLLTDDDRATINRLPRNQRAARVADIAFLASAPPRDADGRRWLPIDADAKPKRVRKPRATATAAA